MPRIHGYSEVTPIDHHVHIPTFYDPGRDEVGSFQNYFPVSDVSTYIVDIAASRTDISIDIFVTEFDGGFHQKARLTGPWLDSGNRGTISVVDVIDIACDAVKEGKTKSAIEIVAEAIANGRVKSQGSVLRTIIVPVRAPWYIRATLNEGAVPGPCDIWIRTLTKRDVA